MLRRYNAQAEECHWTEQGKGKKRTRKQRVEERDGKAYWEGDSRKDNFVRKRAHRDMQVFVKWNEMKE